MNTATLIDLLYEAATEITNYAGPGNIVATRLIEAAKELEAVEESTCH